MQKPIESGCLVVITDASDPANIGVSGLALEMEANATYPGIYWLVDKTGIFHNQKCLRRIDGGNPDAVQEEAQDQEVPTDAIA